MRWLCALALCTAAVALFVSLNPPTPRAATPPAPMPAACDTTALQSQIAALQAQTTALRMQAAALRSDLESRRSGEPAPAPAPARATASPDSAPPDSAPPATAVFRPLTVTTPGIRVEARGGALRVTNQDPALTGQVLTLDAESEDGQARTITIMVPPPQ